MRNRHHLASRSHSGTEERRVQRGGPRIDADDLTATQVRRQLLFEFRDGRPVREPLRVDDVPESRENFLAECGCLVLQ